MRYLKSDLCLGKEIFSPRTFFLKDSQFLLDLLDIVSHPFSRLLGIAPHDSLKDFFMNLQEIYLDFQVPKVQGHLNQDMKDGFQGKGGRCGKGGRW